VVSLCSPNRLKYRRQVLVDYGDIATRDLSWVITETNLVARTGDDVDVQGKVTFVFKAHDGEDSLDGPSVLCELATPVSDVRGAEITQAQIAKALKMVRRLAGLSDESVLQTWEASVQRLNVEP
jgi:hypothetical protein